jgi:hypothetical protein
VVALEGEGGWQGGRQGDLASGGVCGRAGRGRRGNDGGTSAQGGEKVGGLAVGRACSRAGKGKRGLSGDTPACKSTFKVTYEREVLGKLLQRV